MEWIDSLMKRLFSLILFVFIVTACANQESQVITNMSIADDLQVKQTIALRAEEKVRKMKEVTEAVAINNKKQLLIAFRVKQFEKFRLPKVEKKIKDALKEEFPNNDINVSSDLKIFLETNKIKNDIYNKKLSEDKITKEIERVKKLSEEQT